MWRFRARPQRAPDRVTHNHVPRRLRRRDRCELTGCLNGNVAVRESFRYVPIPGRINSTRCPVKAERAGSTGVGSASSIPPAALFPTHYPVPALPVAPEPPPHQKRPQLSPTVWPEIAERARDASLRDLAADYGVSHETIRTIVGRIALQERAGQVA